MLATIYTASLTRLQALADQVSGEIADSKLFLIHFNTVYIPVLTMGLHIVLVLTMASIDIQALNKHLETIKKKHSDRVNILKVTNAQLHATIAGLRLAEEDSRRLVQTKAVENERLETEQERLRKKYLTTRPCSNKETSRHKLKNLKLKEQLTQVSADNRKLHSEIQSLKDNMNQLSGNLELKNSEEMEVKDDVNRGFFRQ